MEFVSKAEVTDVLDDLGCEEQPDGEERVYLSMQDHEGAVHLHLVSSESASTAREGAKVLQIDAESLPGLIEQIIHRLNLSDILLIPVGKWRKVFDAVAFSLAANEEWQAFDTAATRSAVATDSPVPATGPMPASTTGYSMPTRSQNSVRSVGRPINRLLPSPTRACACRARAP